MHDDWSGEDRAFMQLALEQAGAAARLGEVPVGAVLVRAGRVVASAHNLRETLGDPTAHAELLAIRHAAAASGGWRLDDASMYVTLEPCPMCAGGLWLARVARLVYAAADPKAGAAGTLYNVVADPRLNHRLRVDSGLLAAESQTLLRAFFAGLRSERRGDAGAVRAHGGAAAVRMSDPEGGDLEGCPSG